MDEQLMLMKLDTIKNQILTVVYMIVYREAHENGLIDDEEYKSTIRDTISQLDKLVEIEISRLKQAIK